MPARVDDSAPLTMLDLFSGAGGLSEGFRSTRKFHAAQAVEMDASAAATYSLNHRDTKVHVGKIEDWLATGDVPTVDVIVGGPPCQGFSNLGNKDAQDARNLLWREYAKTIIRANPSYFVVENVPNFLSSPQFQSFQTATETGDLSEYTFKATVLNAADYGAPQARRRAVLIGHRRDLPFPGWPDRTHLDKHQSVGRAFEHIPLTPESSLPERTTYFNNEAFPGAFTTEELHVSRNYSVQSLLRFGHIPPGGNRFNIPDELLSPCWRKHKTGATDVMGRLKPELPSVTIRTEFFKPEKGRYLHPTEHRAITHYEAAILQGFPVSYRWAGSRVSIARQIGNAVPIPLAKAIARRLFAASRETTH